MSKSLVDIGKKYSDARAEHDPDAIEARHTKDSMFHLHDSCIPATGRRAVRELILTLFAAAPDVGFELKLAHLGTGESADE